jgi:hypothetical protein
MITKQQIRQYKIYDGNVEKLTGIKADLYVFTIDQLNELITNQTLVNSNSYTLGKFHLTLDENTGDLRVLVHTNRDNLLITPKSDNSILLHARHRTSELPCNFITWLNKHTKV